ncbi:leukocyte-associated immunoglobulin-like receptor 1 isoform X1 [Manis javanica]|uniref:leukocyte-associated immunoglobulin-like receptor 1 isoform X1 n=1 Tax=Manis javanica TaxID=9974 RepID=UPI003C6CCE47
MTPHLPSLLGLALCVGQVIRTQEGALPRPSIRADPSSVIPRGQPVTIECHSPTGFDTFRLEKEGTGSHSDMKNPLHETVARFPIPADEDIAGHYHCIYLKGSWSERSELLELRVTAQASDPCLLIPLPGDTQTHAEDSNDGGLSAEHIYILAGASVAFLLCLLLLIVFLLRRHQKKHRPHSNAGKEQMPQERACPAVDALERTPDLATVDRLPEKDRDICTSTPAAGDLQEVTYAQLDHRVLTQRVAQAASPQSTEPTAESSTYAALTRH